MKHKEPEDIEVWETSFSYTGINYLKRLASYLLYDDDPQKMPSPGGKSNDEKYDQFIMDEAISLIIDLEGKDKSDTTIPNTLFSHLLSHSPTEGFYLPQDFYHYILTDKNVVAGNGIIGSSQRLLIELEFLAKQLNLDLTNMNSEKIGNLIQTPQGIGSTLAEQYGWESFACYFLSEAAKYSIKMNATLVFC